MEKDKKICNYTLTAETDNMKITGICKDIEELNKQCKSLSKIVLNSKILSNLQLKVTSLSVNKRMDSIIICFLYSYFTLVKQLEGNL